MRHLSLCVVAVLVVGLTSAWANDPPAPDALTEGAAGQWGAEAQNGTAAVFNDSARVRVGSSSLRFETDGPFDTWLWAPASRNAAWDMTDVGGFAFWVWAENPNLGFQNHSPWIRLHTTQQDYYEFRPDYDILNDARGQWIEMVVPMTGDELWERSAVGSPSLGLVQWIEIHADTWGAGFTLWIDGLRFDVSRPAPRKQRAFIGNARVDLTWERYDDPTSTFASYAVYRDTEPFSNITGMTPIAVLPNIETTSFLDVTAVNGVSYHYAITARFTTGDETREVESIGPRTPRDETDLQIASIARTPRFPRYAATYTYYEVTEPSGFGPYIFSAATGLGSGQTGTEQRWPNVGQVMTYTATIRNRGTNFFASNVVVVWRVNGQVVNQQVPFIGLSPGAITQVQYQRPWTNASETIECTINVSDARLGNNALSLDAKSVPFLSYIDRTRIEEFREETPDYPQATSDDFIDWLNNHMTEFNRLFEEAGSAKRVHFDVLEVLGDDTPTPTNDRSPFGIFPLRYFAGEGSLRTAGYYRPSVDIDYGLLHELAHQLGLIDIYRLNIDQSQNEVNATGYSAIPCLMNGVSDFLSDHSSHAMNHWLNTAHGYYGQYLYRTPETTRLRILGANAQPLSGATVTVYQKCERPGLGERITTQIKAQGVTDAQGLWTIPNVPINPALAPITYAGDQLRANPFGYIAVVGTNAVFLIKVEHAGFAAWTWLDITELNNAFDEGQTQTAIFERELPLGGSIQTIPPRDMAELNGIDWAAWAQGGSATIFDDQQRTIAGQGSIRFETDGGFDTYARYPGGGLLAQWDLSDVERLRFWVWAENPNIGFQNHSPWIHIGDANGHIVLRPTSDLLNEARGQWRECIVPIAGDATWQRSVVGSPDITSINWVEIHADTWGAGFTLWFDGVGFEPTPCYPDCDQSTGPGVLDIFDFLCFGNLFSANDPYACDCDTSTGPGVCDIFDFLCFGNAFHGGCQ